MVTVAVGLDVQPVEVWVNVNVTVPAETPVIRPALVMVALEILLLVHVPPVVGDTLVVLPTQTSVGPVTETTGLALTLIVAEAVAVHARLFVTVTT